LNDTVESIIVGVVGGVVGGVIFVINIVEVIIVSR